MEQHRHREEGVSTREALKTAVLHPFRSGIEEGNGRRAQGMNPLNAPAQPGGRDHTPSGRGSQSSFAMADMNQVRPNAMSEDGYLIQGPGRYDEAVDTYTPHGSEQRGIVRYNAGPIIPDARRELVARRSEGCVAMGERTGGSRVR